MPEYTEGRAIVAAGGDAVYIGHACICDVEVDRVQVDEATSKANAHRLAHCWNCHDDLVAALEWYAGEGTGDAHEYRIVDERGETVVSDFSTFGGRARAALLKAKGDQP